MLILDARELNSVHRIDVKLNLGPEQFGFDKKFLEVL
jgi:hypothetical protein